MIYPTLCCKGRGIPQNKDTTPICFSESLDCGFLAFCCKLLMTPSVQLRVQCNFTDCCFVIINFRKFSNAERCTVSVQQLSFLPPNLGSKFVFCVALFVLMIHCLRVNIFGICCYGKIVIISLLLLPACHIHCVPKKVTPKFKSL